MAPTTIGPFCKVGGELNNVVMQGYSNKAHDGFLGNAVIGEWCNLWVPDVASNLKNDYTPHKTVELSCAPLLAYRASSSAGLSWATIPRPVSILCSIRPRSSVSVSISMAQVFRVISWHRFRKGAAGFSEVSMTKFFAIARRVMARRGRELGEADERMFYAIREAAESYK